MWNALFPVERSSTSLPTPADVSCRRLCQNCRLALYMDSPAYSRLSIPVKKIGGRLVSPESSPSTSGNRVFHREKSAPRHHVLLPKPLRQVHRLAKRDVAVIIARGSAAPGTSN